MSNTSISQLSQSVVLSGTDEFVLDSESGTLKTTLTSMSAFVDGVTYPQTTVSLLGDRVKLSRGGTILSFQPGTSIFKDVPTGSGNAESTQIVMGSDTRLSDARVALSHNHSVGDIYLLQSELDKRIRTSSIGISGGVASLDGFGKIPLSQIPTSVSGQVVYIGVWNAVSNTPTLSNVSGVNNASLVKGNYYVVTNAGTVSFGSGGMISFGVGDWVISDGVTWNKVNNADNIRSISGKSGSVVVLSASDIPDVMSVSGSTMLPNSTISVSKVPTSSFDITNKSYVDNNFLSLAGGTLLGDVLMISSSLQLGSINRYIYPQSDDSIAFYKDSNINFRVYDTGNVYIRSKLSVSGSLSTSGNIGIGVTNPSAKVHVGGTAGVDGVKFPDGTMQTTAYVSNSGINSSSVAKLWVNFNGSTGAIRSSSGVASVTKLSVGTYRINFSSDLGNSNYCAIAGRSHTTSTDITNDGIILLVNTYLNTSVNIYTGQDSGSPVDPFYVTLVVFSN